MKTGWRRINNVEFSWQSSGIRYHSNPYSEAMGPIVKEGFVADRIQNLQRVESKLGHSLPSRAPTTPHPIVKKVQTYESCSSPDLDLIGGHSNRSYGLDTPPYHTKQLACQSSNGKQWIKSSPSTPVLRTTTGAALYWDRKIQSLRHPPTREALEIRRLRRGLRSYENVNQSTSFIPDTPSRRSTNRPYPGKRDADDGRREEREAQTVQNLIPQQGSGISHQSSIRDQMGDMIHHIDQALRGEYDSSVEMANEAPRPNSHHADKEFSGTKSATPRRQLFSESQPSRTPSFSDVTTTSRGEAHSSRIAVSDCRSILSKDGSRLDKLDDTFGAEPQEKHKIIMETTPPKRSSGNGSYPTEQLSPPDGRARAWSFHNVDALKSVQQPLVKPHSLSTSHARARIVFTDNPKPFEEPNFIDPSLDQPHHSIPQEPEPVRHEIANHHQASLNIAASSSRQPSGANRKASVASIKSTSSQGSKKWRWWKLALVDKQPKGHEPRKRQSTTDLAGLDVRLKKRDEDENETVSPHLPVEMVLETEAEREHTLIDEVLDGCPNRGPPDRGLPAPYSPSLAETRKRRSDQWVAALPGPGSAASEAQTPSHPGSLRAAVGQEARKKDQRIKKVQVIVSLDGASDLVVEASLERKRRKSFS